MYRNCSVQFICVLWNELNLRNRGIYLDTSGQRNFIIIIFIIIYYFCVFKLSNMHVLAPT